MNGQPIRKRMKRYEEPGGARFVTFSCHRRLALLGDARIRGLFAARLAAVRRQMGFELFAWVAMPEHVHLLVRPSAGIGLDRALLSLKLSVAQRVIARWRQLEAPILRDVRTGDAAVRFWQKGGGLDRNVRDVAEFTKHVRYIHRNPMKRGLVRRPEDWEWSSVRWWMGRRDGEVECDEPPEGLSSWRGFV